MHHQNARMMFAITTRRFAVWVKRTSTFPGEAAHRTAAMQVIIRRWRCYKQNETSSQVQCTRAVTIAIGGCKLFKSAELCSLFRSGQLGPRRWLIYVCCSLLDLSDSIWKQCKQKYSPAQLAEQQML